MFFFNDLDPFLLFFDGFDPFLLALYDFDFLADFDFRLEDFLADFLLDDFLEEDLFVDLALELPDLLAFTDLLEVLALLNL